MSFKKRLLDDFKDLLKCNTENCGIAVVMDDNIDEFRAFVKGPPDTPYEGGTFHLTVSVPSSYPMKPPLVTFVTKIWHPNVSSVSGYICLNILSKDWTGDMNLRSVLLSVQNLLVNPEPDDSQDDLVGRQCFRSMDIFRKTATMWTYLYASGPNCIDEYKQNVDNMIALGVSRDIAILSLTKSDWEWDSALDEALDV